MMWQNLKSVFRVKNANSEDIPSAEVVAGIYVCTNVFVKFYPAFFIKAVIRQHLSHSFPIDFQVQ